MIRHLVSELRKLVDEGVLKEDDLAGCPMDGDLDDWEEWANGILDDEDDEVEEARNKVPIPAHYVKTCSLRAFQQNIRYFVHKKKAEPKQAVAASYTILRKHCGVPKDAPRMTPKQIVAGGES